MASWIDRTIAAFAPQWGLKRQIARQTGKFLASADPASGVYNSAYQGSMGSRVSSPWSVSPTNPQFRYVSKTAQRDMRNRARSLEKNNEIAEALLTTTVNNVVGPKGFQLQATTDNTAWNTQAKAFWDDWTQTADKSGLSWVEHCDLVIRSFLRDGDIGSILTDDGSLQAIEGDLICDPDVPDTAIDKKLIVNGVELDSFNNPINFYVSQLTNEGKTTALPVAANNFVFFSRTNRFGQVRGEPAFAPIFDLLDQISKWKDAELMAARLSACFGLAITKTDGGATAMAAAAATGQAVTNSGGVAQNTMSIEPGMIQYLQPGESIETIAPSNPGRSFPENLLAMLRLAGLPFGLPIELVLLDFSKVNYSSARASLIQASNAFKKLQQRFIARYLKRIYQWRISKAIKEGDLPPCPLDKNGKPQAWQHRWIAYQPPYLDPTKEAQAIQMFMDMGLTTLKAQLEAEGKDLDTYITERGGELKKLAAAGIPSLHSQALLEYGATGTGTATPKTDNANPDDANDTETVDDVGETVEDDGGNND